MKYTVRNLNYQLKQLCRYNRDGGYATRHDRERLLTLIAEQLYEMGYRRMAARSLKPKHVVALVRRWQAESLSAGTIKNRMAAVRWWAAKVGKRNAVARRNEHYGIERRVYAGAADRAVRPDDETLARIADPHVRMSVELQRAFGLRREEAIKFRPNLADHGEYLRLQASWTKGGKPRDVPVCTEAQRALLERARALAGTGSLIPGQRSYIQQRKKYDRDTAKAGLRKLHGLRHAYAQDRYEALTGWKAPIAGGPAVKSLSEAERTLDERAREIVSRELGHERSEITTVYLGR